MKKQFSLRSLRWLIVLVLMPVVVYLCGISERKYYLSALLVIAMTMAIFTGLLCVIFGLVIHFTGANLEEESIRFLLSGVVDYELRTTVVLPLHTEASVSQMGQWLYSLNGGEKIPRLYLQLFVDRDTVPVAGLAAPGSAELDTFVSKLTPFVAFVKVRGI